MAKSRCIRPFLSVLSAASMVIGAAAEQAGEPLASIEYKSSFANYEMLRVAEGQAHAIAVGFGPRVSFVPWHGAQTRELLIGGAAKGFATRLALYAPADRIDSGTGLPVYREGVTVPLAGKGFIPVNENGGRFDLVADASGTPLGAGRLILYKNEGEVGDPRFGQPVELLVGGRPLGEHWSNLKAGEWTLADVTRDGIPDLLITAAPRDQTSYFPDGVSMWNGQDHPSSGKGRGYDLDGNWLGGRLTVDFWWAPGVGVPGDLRGFGRLQPIYSREAGVPLRWRAFHRYAAPGYLKLGGKAYLLAFGAVDQMRALELTHSSDGLMAGPAQPLLAGGQRLEALYVVANIATGDLDGDGEMEIVMAGNPGRVAVLKGSDIGAFREVGSLESIGGVVETDGLVVPSLWDWDEDGRPDLITGDASGFFMLWPGTDDPRTFGSPRYFQEEGKRVHIQSGYGGSIQGPEEGRWGYLSPTVGKWGEGAAKMISTDSNGELLLWGRSKTDTLELRRRIFTRGGEPFRVSWRSRPAIVSADHRVGGIPAPALLLQDWEGELSLVRTTMVGGTEVASSTKILDEQGRPIAPTGKGGHWGRASLAVGDWDGDGRWDVLLGTGGFIHRFFMSEPFPHEASPMWFRNVGTNAHPVLAAPEFIRLKDGTFIHMGGHNASAWPADIDGDGRLDLVVGAEDGRVYVFPREALLHP